MGQASHTLVPEFDACPGLSESSLTLKKSSVGDAQGKQEIFFSSSDQIVITGVVTTLSRTETDQGKRRIRGQAYATLVPFLIGTSVPLQGEGLPKL